MAAILRCQLRTENSKIKLFDINHISRIHAAGPRRLTQALCHAFTNIGVCLEGFPTGLSTGGLDLFEIDVQALGLGDAARFLEQWFRPLRLALRLRQESKIKQAAAEKGRPLRCARIRYREFQMMPCMFGGEQRI
ncbi:MAG: hypothetical protein QF449_16655, partial [Alphaproteobacteria bacterium]|nr:hypothetical protein [Alphaproteobacteria bacterium]